MEARGRKAGRKRQAPRPSVRPSRRQTLFWRAGAPRMAEKVSAKTAKGWPRYDAAIPLRKDWCGVRHRTRSQRATVECCAVMTQSVPVKAPGGRRKDDLAGLREMILKYHA